MATKSLTDVQLRNLKPDPKKRFEVWDGQLPGFGVRVASTGTKTFIFLYRLHGRARRMTFGRYPTLTLADARVQARTARNAVDRGEDPQADTRIKTVAGKATPTKQETRPKYRVDNVVAEFVLRHCRRHNRPSTAQETERVLNAHLVMKWPAKDIRDIAKSDILRILDNLVDAGKPSAANHAFAAIRKFFNWCVERGLLETTPCLGIKSPAKMKSRSRVLTDQELANVWRASEQADYPFGTIVRLLILTGQRRSEVGSIKWEDIDVDTQIWTLPPEANKSGRAHSVPLVSTAIDLFKRSPRQSETFVFPSLRSNDRCFSGYSKCKIRLDELSSVTNWTLHDLRRTVATGLAQQGVQPHVVEKVLNHASGTFSGVAGVYNRFGYLDEMREALVAWDSHLAELIVT